MHASYNEVASAWNFFSSILFIILVVVHSLVQFSGKTNTREQRKPAFSVMLASIKDTSCCMHNVFLVAIA
jgi:hypothetical protein